ncbi:MAG: M48 family metallopeptidase [Anaerolineales bacterium]|nr:M48 family metallopeptidase [Anaerolineales bacterium]
MSETIEIGGIPVEVVFKDIKNIHLSVYPPNGRVHISAPERMNLDTIRVYAISKLDWIRKQQTKFREAERETQREYLNRESHFVWGQRYLLYVVEENQPPRVELKHSELALYVRPGSSQEKREEVVAAWYRELVREAAAPLIAKWEEELDVKVQQLFVRRMKTKWGSCNPHKGLIRLNTELAKKTPECLEYIVAHELMHFLEPHHGDRFQELMDHHMPHWRHYRDELNRAPLGHVEWEY